MIALLFVRSTLSQMDVPTRSSYVMAIVEPHERPAAASVTSVPRSLASAASPRVASAESTPRGILEFFAEADEPEDADAALTRESEDTEQ